jgi:hypothetical protein
MMYRKMSDMKPAVETSFGLGNWSQIVVEALIVGTIVLSLSVLSWFRPTKKKHLTSKLLGTLGCIGSFSFWALDFVIIH